MRRLGVLDRLDAGVGNKLTLLGEQFGQARSSARYLADVAVVQADETHQQQVIDAVMVRHPKTASWAADAR